MKTPISGDSLRRGSGAHPLSKRLALGAVRIPGRELAIQSRSCRTKEMGEKAV